MDVDDAAAARAAPSLETTALFFGVAVPRWAGAAGAADDDEGGVIDADDGGAEGDGTGGGGFGGGGGGAPAVVPTASALRNARALGATLSASRASRARGRPLLVEGPAGCGKTLLLRALAAAAGAPPLVELHLDESTDGRALLGGHACGDVPGEFFWAPGALTRAAEAGRWVLVEDIDRAPYDVLAALATLLESRALPLPGRPRDATVHAGFQFFATRRTPRGRDAPPPAGALAAFADLFLRVRFADADADAGAGAAPAPAPRALPSGFDALDADTSMESVAAGAPAPAPATAPPPASPPAGGFAAALAQLTAMGFPAAEARQMLELAGGDVAAALELLSG